MTASSRFLRPLSLGLAAAVAALALSGCAAEEPGETSGTDSTAEESGDHNDADVEFATQMIPHHAQALVMTDMAIGRQLDRDFLALVDGIREAQAPEIEVMADWLQEWGEPIPETARDHVHGGHGDGADMSQMAGMMTEEQLAELESASPADFEQLWLAMMIEHHEGAVAMAETQLEEGSYQPALELAEEIASSQTEEIALMRAMLEQ